MAHYTEEQLVERIAAQKEREASLVEEREEANRNVASHQSKVNRNLIKIGRTSEQLKRLRNSIKFNQGILDKMQNQNTEDTNVEKETN